MSKLATQNLHVRLPQKVAERLDAYCEATFRRRTDVIIQGIMDLELPGQPRLSMAPTPGAARSAVRSPYFLSRAPDMVVIEVPAGSRTKRMIFSRPSRQTDQWLWTILWRKGRDVPGYDIETRPIPEILGDLDVWAKLETGEAVVFDKAVPEHRQLILWPAGMQPQSLEEYERDAARQAERFDRYVKSIGRVEDDDDEPEATPIAALEDEEA